MPFLSTYLLHESIFSVCFSLLCPKRLVMVWVLVPLFRIFTAKEWRAQCQLICLLMAACFTHRLIDLLQLSYKRRLKIEEFKLSGASPIKESKPSLRGIITPLCTEYPWVLFYLNFNRRLVSSTFL